MADLKQLFSDLVRDEGLRLKPYRDSVRNEKYHKGILTIGVGRNLEDVGITEQEAIMLLKNDIDHLMDDPRIQSIIKDHDVVRQGIILNMAFNMGVPRLMGFKRMLAAFATRNYNIAAREMEDSAWWGQVGPRAVRLQKQMRGE